MNQQQMNKTDLSTFSKTGYDPGASAAKRSIWYVVNMVFFASRVNIFSGLKVHLLRLFGAHVGRGVYIKPAVNIKLPWKLFVGDHCWIGEGSWIDNLEPVTLGPHVCLSQGCLLLTGNHDYKKSTFDYKNAPIVIEEGGWIGAKATVCPGVTVRSYAILSVGSVATHDLEPYTIYQGVPAVAVRKRVIG